MWEKACNIHLDPIVNLKKCIRTITYSSYLEHTQPLFNRLNILCFHKLLILRISLIMFKIKIGVVLKPISQLFTRNSEYHDYNTKHSSSFHLSVGRSEAIYRSFSFHGINIWNQLKMHVPTDVSYICFKKLTLSYLIANDIVYRMKS